MKSFLKFFFFHTILFSSISILNAQSVTWQKKYDKSRYDDGKCGIQTFDGGYIIAAFTYSPGENNMLIKLDSFGNEVWTKTPDNAGFNRWVIQTKDSGYVIAYSHDSLAKIVKTDKLGNFVWKKYFSINNQNTGFYKVKELRNGDLIMCGTISFHPSCGYVVKTDSKGNMLWQKSLPNDTSSSGEHLIYESDAIDITESNDSFYYVTGIVSIYSLVAKLSVSGDLIWYKFLGSNGELDHEYSSSIITESDNVISIAGRLYDNSFSKTHLTKIDSSGNVINKYLYESMYGFGAMTKYNNGYALCGLNSNGDNIRFIKVCINGTEISNIVINNNNKIFSYSNSIINTSDNGFFITGLAGPEENLDVLAIKTDSTGYAPVSVKNLSNEIPSAFELYQNYPNPFNPETKISYELRVTNYVSVIVCDVLGNEIQTLVNQKQNVGRYEVVFDGSILPSGVYFYKLTTGSPREAGDFTDVKRMVLLK